MRARLNERLAERLQYLHLDTSGSDSLVDLAKAKPLASAQIEALARETGALDPRSDHLPGLMQMALFQKGQKTGAHRPRARATVFSMT